MATPMHAYDHVVDQMGHVSSINCAIAAIVAIANHGCPMLLLFFQLWKKQPNNQIMKFAGTFEIDEGTHMHLFVSPACSRVSTPDMGGQDRF